MTPQISNRRAHLQPQAGRAGARSVRNSQARRKTFKQAVPSDVQARLDESLRQGGRLSERLTELYESHALDQKFGVTLPQFRRFASGVKNRTSAPDTPTQIIHDGHDARTSRRSTDPNGTDREAPSPTASPAAPVLGREAFHRRMKAIGEIVDSTFGVVAAHQPDLWGHGAYLMLVGSVVACLAERHAELSTSELATLSKILTEQRSVTLKQAEADRKLADRQSKTTAEQSSLEAAGTGEARARKLPAHFGDVVRQIYGTSFQDDFTVDSGATGGLPTSAETPDSLPETLVDEPPVAPRTIHHE